MTPEDMILADNFLDKLQNSWQGRAIAVNMYESCADNLVSRDALHAFLHDCVRTHEAFPTKNAVDIIDDVSCGFGHTKKTYLRQYKLECFTSIDTERWSNTVNAFNFHKYFIADKYKDCSGGLPVVLPLQPDDCSHDEYKERLSMLTANPAWRKTGSTIGRPFQSPSDGRSPSPPSNCWITSDQFGKDAQALEYIDDSATEARDELGLDYGHGEFLLRLSFLASSIAKIPDHELARPVFSDLGNSRFRVRQSSSRATEFAKQDWGATTHLGKFGDKKFTDSTGVCERISSPLPLITLESLSVEFLGKVNKNRGDKEHDNREAYVNDLEAGRNKAEIKNKLLSFLN